MINSQNLYNQNFAVTLNIVQVNMKSEELSDEAEYFFESGDKRDVDSFKNLVQLQNDFFAKMVTKKNSERQQGQFLKFEQEATNLNTQDHFRNLIQSQQNCFLKMIQEKEKTKRTIATQKRTIATEKQKRIIAVEKQKRTIAVEKQKRIIAVEKEITRRKQIELNIMLNSGKKQSNLESQNKLKLAKSLSPSKNTSKYQSSNKNSNENNQSNVNKFIKNLSNANLFQKQQQERQYGGNDWELPYFRMSKEQQQKYLAEKAQREKKRNQEMKERLNPYNKKSQHFDYYSPQSKKDGRKGSKKGNL